VLVVTVLGLVACDGDKALDDTALVADSGGALSDEDIAAQLWSDSAGYDAWSQYDPWLGVQASSSPHGPYVQIWVNDAAVSTLGGTVADGGVLVKESYDTEDGEATGLTLMAKIEGYDPDNGDWFWASYSMDGTVKKAGSESGCYGCHEAGSDYSLIVTTAPASDTGA